MCVGIGKCLGFSFEPGGALGGGDELLPERGGGGDQARRSFAGVGGEDEDGRDENCARHVRTPILCEGVIFAAGAAESSAIEMRLLEDAAKAR